MNSKTLFLTLGLAACAAPTDAAQVLFTNPIDPTNGFSAWTSCRAADGSGYRVLDAFQLNSWARITRVTWVGVYWDYVQHSNNPVGPQTTNWQISFYADNAGSPGTVVQVFQLPAASVTSTVISNATLLGDPVFLRLFTADLPTPFHLPANVPYWFSVLSQQALFNPLFSWTSGGPGACLQMTLPGGSTVVLSGNRAFTIEGDPFVGRDSIDCGQTLANNITNVAQSDTYVFTANAGEVAVILVEGQPGTPKWFNAVADVYNPNGIRIGSLTNWGTRIWLTNSGTFTILVHADDYSHLGQYGMSLSFATGRCGEPLIWGLPASGAIAIQGEGISYTFSGWTGETWNISVYGEPGTPKWFNALANIYDPTGNRLAAVVNGPTTITLTNTGTHTILVSADDLNHLGMYSLSTSLVGPVPGSYRLGIGITNGAAALSVWGQLGRTTAIEYATNLAATNVWLPLTNFSLPWSPYRLVHWSSTNSPQGYYRFRQLP